MSTVDKLGVVIICSALAGLTGITTITEIGNIFYVKFISGFIFGAVFSLCILFIYLVLRSCK